MIVRYILFIISFRSLGVHGIGEKCKNNTECNGNAICIQDICSCDQISYNNNGTCLSYVTEYKTFCQEGEQCEWLGKNANCIRDVCICEENYRWYKGECRRFYRKTENCNDTIDCYDGIDPLALQCSSGVCECNTDYYDRGPDCRKKSKKNGNCALDIDCIDKNLVCHLGKCMKPTKMIGMALLPEDDSYIREKKGIKNVDLKKFINESNTIPCKNDGDCKAIANSVCHMDTHTCQCNSDTHFFHEANCLPGFGICSNDEDCTTSNTKCFKGVCLCKQGFFLNNNKCAPEIGMTDSSITDETSCPMKPAKVQDEACFCRDYWFGDDTNRNCIKTTLQQTLSCLNNDWCNAMGPNSYCDTKNQCRCSTFANLNETNFYCEGSDTADCLRDSECGFNEKCEYEKCVCLENFSMNSLGVCQPDLGGSCSVLPCTNVEKSNCKEGVCQCDENYIDDENRCLELAQSWNDTCEVSKQCPFKFSECGKSKKCSCSSGYTVIEGTCWQIKEYGDPCMNELDCTKVLNQFYQCRNNKCLCPIGEILEDGYCVSSSHYSLPSLLLISLLLYISILI